jgi:uncharacterized membrane protein YkvA (DUF1232 family)
MTDQHTPTRSDDLPGFYNHWRGRVHSWIADRSREELADAVLILPDLFALVIRLIRDGRTPLRFKSQLIMVAAYVLLPVDLIPEAAFGAAGLADDALVVSVMLMRLLNQANDLDPHMLRELWSGKGDIVDVLTEVVESDGEVVNTRVWRRVRAMFGNPGPEPAVVDGRTTDQQI